MTNEILVLVEHRKGEIREITYEMLAKGRELADGRGGKLVALLLGDAVADLVPPLAARADVVEVVEHPGLAHFNSDAYQQLLARRLRAGLPLLLMMGHTAYGLELAPGLATDVGLPLITDATDVDLADGIVVAMRPMYGGKARARVRARGTGAIVTVQIGAFAAAPERDVLGEVVRTDWGVVPEAGRKSFLGFVETQTGDDDITQSDIIVSVGRGIGDPQNLPMVEELAAALGGVLACSRPVVDKKWLPKSRQVGISGKTVQPKLYLAVGISGAFQHLAGMRRSGTVVAINKDPNAPIFRVADYAVVGDLFTVVPALVDRIAAAKARRAA
ncbi:MAG: electron transfer flavoprotein subunit alpha/FixB family protein [Sphingomonadaceae bacterium]